MNLTCEQIWMTYFAAIRNALTVAGSDDGDRTQRAAGIADEMMHQHFCRFDIDGNPLDEVYDHRWHGPKREE
jgi:hypothetical protein